MGVRLKLVSAIIILYLDYFCLLFLDNTAENDAIWRRALNACIRFVFRLKRRTHITQSYECLECLTVRKCRLYFLGALTYQILSSRTTAYLFEKQQLPVHKHTYRLRVRANALHVPFARLDIFQISFSYIAPKFWNSLPISITSSGSLDIFKKQLKKYY